MNKKQKKVLIRVIVASVLLILCAVLPTMAMCDLQPLWFLIWSSDTIS